MIQQIMKKILYVLVLAVIAVACQEMYGPIPVPNDPVYSNGIDIALSEVADDSFVVTLTPKGESAFYSYLVTEGAQAQALDSANVYALKYSGVSKGTFNYAEATSKTVQISGLKPNTAYQVYAVAGSKTGIPSKVANASVRTSDTGAPYLTALESEGNTVTLTYSEPVTYTGTKVAAEVYPKMMVTEKPVASVTGEVSVESNVVTITFADIEAPGSYFTFGYPAGTFVDVLNNKCSAVIPGTFFWDEDDEIDCSEPFWGFIENVGLTAKVPDIKSVFLKDYGDSLLVNVPGLYSIDNKSGYATKISHKDDSFSSESTWPMASGTDYYADGENIVIKPIGTPQPGDYVSIVIPAGAVMDIYGNTNASDIVIGPIEIMSEPLALTYTLAGAGANNLVVDVKTNDLSGVKYWIYDYAPKEEMAEISDEDFIANLIELIAGYAEMDELSFEEELATYFAMQGDDQITLVNGTSSTEYEFAGFYLDGEGNVLSDVFRFDASTTELVLPEAATGTYMANIYFQEAYADLPLSFESAEEGGYVGTISGWGPAGIDFVFYMDEDGNIQVPMQDTGDTFMTYGPIYVEELDTWNESGWSQTSYYDSINDRFVFTLIYYVSAGYLGYGTAAETFELGESEEAPASVKSASSGRKATVHPAKSLTYRPGRVR